MGEELKKNDKVTNTETEKNIIEIYTNSEYSEFRYA